jgi:NAD-dependent SIR2 family protein deacetylase
VVAHGFPEAEVLECHGPIRHLQCNRRCRGIWPAERVRMAVDETTVRATSEPPACPACGAVARPNVLMFGDGDRARGMPGSKPGTKPG